MNCPEAETMRLMLGLARRTSDRPRPPARAIAREAHCLGRLRGPGVTGAILVIYIDWWCRYETHALLPILSLGEPLGEKPRHTNTASRLLVVAFSSQKTEQKKLAPSLPKICYM
jgi:hypothetical protein